MREWTRDERYRVLQSADEVRDLFERIRKSPYRQTYHIQPVTGLSSDPNGFACYNGVWHLFYQWCPWGAVHGLKYWYHVSSPDLISWKNEGVGLAPDCIYDNKGTHSGSAIAEGDDLYFFYTGNHRDENWVRTPYTCAAVLGKDGKPVKLEKPLFGPRDDYSEHQRDPKVVWNEEKKKYYIFIGAQTLDKRGTVLIYESEELLKGWKFSGQLNVPGFEQFGGMWECPCIQRISGKDVLIFSPQYTRLPGRGESTNHNVYLVGQMDYDTLTFTPDSDYRYLDYGFDFYAAQLAANVNDPDKAIIVSWIGLPDNHYPTEEEDWEGSMILPRELRLRDGKLIQTPISGIETLREAEISPEGTLPDACEVQAVCPGGDFDLNLFTKEDGTGGFTIHYNEAEKKMTVNRKGMNKRFNTNVFEELDVPLENGLKSLRIFIDRSSVELFINDGEETFTSHIYPEENEHHYTVSTGTEMHIWPLKASVKDDFVI
ncbi:MAG: sucrose-6-phosphate hydrolase [Erysipelotrichaceae bacterium]|nr:sucrose-6-phosphate hydrolase [Erysipelotrichaceae bacterium]